MSGHPNSQDIVELRACLLALKVEDAEVVKATTDKSNAEKRLTDAQERGLRYLERIDKLMEKMDVAGPGNTGYKNRLYTLLTALAEK